ncbi:hypothetical protein CEP52_014915 [Fusarium oligoseptatum]|uniref:Branched-chain-amino-acid aminotransferase n=1 Tax=Fusarium oligoseptatum TaxID=2604345 RepID=A0A428SHZ9_9HYPO|nr:hypothetical protein CEP52_014915 [Fusarium oligoseptatum]
MAGLFMIGNTADPNSYHWIVPMIAATMMGLGFFTIFQSVISYQIDTFPQYAASAVAANTFMRSMLASIFPPIVPKMYSALGIKNASHLTGYVALALLPIPWIFFYFGARIRAKGRWTARSEIDVSPQPTAPGDDVPVIVQDIDPDQSHQTDSGAQQRIVDNSVASPLVVEPFLNPQLASIRVSQDHGLIDTTPSPRSSHEAVPTVVETRLERFPLVESPEQQQAGSTPQITRFEITGIEAIFPVIQDSPASSEWTDQQTDTSWCGFLAVAQEPEPSSVAPPGLFEAAKFPQDMIYYHHLCDPSLSGLLSVLGVRDVLGVGGLDKGFFHAALALSALHMSQSSSVSKAVADCSALHALDHFVEALGYMRSAHLNNDIATIDAPGRGQNTIAWLATLLLLANFELNRGQIKLWYVHSHAAVTYLSHNVAQVGELPVGKSIIRSFSRIEAYLEIFDRSYTACHSLATSNVSAMLGTSLRTSTDPFDRLLYILPRVGEFEEECRTSPQLDSHWRIQARNLIDELKAWRRSLPDRDVPSADEVDADPWKLSDDSSTLIIRPLTLSRAANPAKAATSFMHYLVSLVRLEMKYSPGIRRKLPENGRKLILVVCRLAAGVSSSVCAASNAYGHGMVPALMNAYYSSDDQAAKAWIKDWISGFPRDREGIWNVRHAHRLLHAIATPPEASAQASQPKLGELRSKGMHRDLVPESEQGPVPASDDPVRFTQKATTAHMVKVRWTAENGWENAEMVPYGKISLEPTASVLHYATETFEGMKVYRGYDNKLRLFRPQLNCARMLRSNARVALPSFSPQGLLDVIASYVATECPRWLPEPGTNLYLRPAMIGSGEALGISVPAEALFFLFAALFPQASKAPHPGVKLLASSSDIIRAWPGGFGDAKVGASYGPAMAAHGRAREKGCGQTLWLFGPENSLDTGVILPGVTRQSVLEIARERLAKDTAPQWSELEPLEVVERPLTMDEIAEADSDGRLVECFVSGTAMFITPVSCIRYDDTDVSFPMTVTSTGTKTPLCQYSTKIKSWLEDIIYGRVKHKWGHIIEE